MAALPSRRFSRFLMIFIIVMSEAFLILPSFHVFAQDRSNPTTFVFPTFLHTYGIRKATRFHLLLFTQNKTKFDDPQGLAVTRLLSWEDSTTTTDDDEVTVYGVNSGENNIIFNKTMKSIGIYGLTETGEQRLNRPQGIAANSTGEVYIADTGNHRIVKLLNPGHDLIFQSSLGEQGAEPGQFNEPFGVALDSKGILYVTDTNNHRIQLLNSDLLFLEQWGEPGQAKGKLNFPTAIAATDKNQEWTFYKQDFVVIIDLNHSRLQQFHPDGKFLRSIKGAEFGYSDCQLSHLAMDYYDNIYVTDTKNHCVHKFDRHLKYLTSFGAYGSGDNEFIEPRGITIYRRFGQVFIAEKWGAQYYWIGADCFDFKATKLADRELFKFTYFLTEPSFVTTDILDEKNRLVTRLWTRQFHASGEQQDFWSGGVWSVADSVFLKEKIEPSPHYQKGKMLAPGKYIVKYRIEPTYSSYRYFEKIIKQKFTKY
ncbi:MAG: NHL repeat-containing protein [bacterium]|nr:NHL repeat-containing protein [bacterium]